MPNIQQQHFAMKAMAVSVCISIRKIDEAASSLYQIERQRKLYPGNLEVKRDWGFAGEYVQAMCMMLQADQPDDYVIATRETHTVRELLDRALSYLDLDWKLYVKIDPRYYRPTEVDLLSRDATKARQVLGREPKAINLSQY